MADGLVHCVEKGGWYPKIIIILLLRKLFPQTLAVVFSIEFGWLQVSSSLQDLLSILADLRNTVVWMVSNCPVIFKFSSPFTNLLGIVPSALTTIGITVTFMLHNFFNSQARSMYLSFFWLSFSFIQWSAGITKSTMWQVLFSFFFFFFFFFDFH